MNRTIAHKTVLATVLDVRELTESTVVIRFERQGIEFQPGQYLSIGLESVRENREYSIYSSPEDEFFEILIREVTDGVLSPGLRAVKPGDILRVAGPYGHFTINNDHIDRDFLFIATGTGISPFRCLTAAYPDLSYRLIHGVSYLNEQYEHEWFGEHYTGCISRESGGQVDGRVTGYIQDLEVAPDTLCYLCGNCDMIYDVFDILIDKGVHPDNLHAEVYF